MQKVNILGTDYVILTHKISEDAVLEKKQFCRILQ